MTTELTVDIFVSLDGFAGSDGLPGYFGYLGPDLQDWITTEGAAPHINVMGRRTYEILSALPEEARDEGWNHMTERDKIVFSRTLEAASWANTRVVHGSLVEEITAIKAASEVPLRTVGSLSLARQLLNAGLVDRLRLAIFPLIAEPSGREPFFADVRSTALALHEHRILDGRVHLVEYRPLHEDIPRA